MMHPYRPLQPPAIHVRRMVQTELGVGPKELLHIIKFQSLLRHFFQFAPTRIVDLAAHYGYYDQSHLIHSFQRFYGLPPAEVFQRRIVPKNDR